MTLRQKLNIGVLGLGLLAMGCDSPKREIILAEREYSGRVKIGLIQEKRIGSDTYTLEVRDSTGTVIAKIETNVVFSDQTYLYVGDNERYTLRYRHVIKEREPSELQKLKETLEGIRIRE